MQCLCNLHIFIFTLSICWSTISTTTTTETLSVKDEEITGTATSRVLLLDVFQSLKTNVSTQRFENNKLWTITDSWNSNDTVSEPDKTANKNKTIKSSRNFSNNDEMSDNGSSSFVASNYGKLTFTGIGMFIFLVVFCCYQYRKQRQIDALLQRLNIARDSDEAIIIPNAEDIAQEVTPTAVRTPSNIDTIVTSNNYRTFRNSHVGFPPPYNQSQQAPPTYEEAINHQQLSNTSSINK